MACGGCKGAPDGFQGTVTIWYCSPQCQKDDWEKHKQACKTAKDRQILYRAADTAQKMLLIFSRATFQWGIERIEKLDGIWLIHQTSPKQIPVKSQLQEFPSKKFPKKEEQLAILTHQHCSVALAYLHDFLKILLKGYSKIEEVTVWIKNANFRMRRIFPGTVIDMTNYKHSILRVTTRAGERYALDMTGAQFGWTDSIIPWDLFADTRILSVDGIEAFGYTKPYLEAKCSSSLGAARAYVHYIQKNFANVLNGLLYDWQRANMLLPALLGLPHEEFKQQQQALMESVESKMQGYRNFAIATKQFPIMGRELGATLPEYSLGSTFQVEKLSI